MNENISQSRIISCNSEKEFSKWSNEIGEDEGVDKAIERLKDIKKISEK